VSWYPSSYADKAAIRAATKAAVKPPDESVEYAILGTLRRAAISAGCTNIRLFTQAVGPVKAALGAQNAAEGACRELAIRWLAAKKSGDGNAFLEALLGLGGTINEEELKKVVEAFKAMGDKNIVEQRSYTENQLKEYFEFVSKTDVLRAPLRMDQGPSESAAKWLFSSADHCEYRLFGIRGFINHATAICLVPGKESFFDPNLGEFQFRNRFENMYMFLDEHIFPKGGDGRGQYIGRDNKKFYDIERICCS
jgi:hypothetical protein